MEFMAPVVCIRGGTRRAGNMEYGPSSSHVPYTATKGSFTLLCYGNLITTKSSVR